MKKTWNTRCKIKYKNSLNKIYCIPNTFAYNNIIDYYIYIFQFFYKNIIWFFFAKNILFFNKLQSEIIGKDNELKLFLNILILSRKCLNNKI